MSVHIGYMYGKRFVVIRKRYEAVRFINAYGKKNTSVGIFSIYRSIIDIITGQFKRPADGAMRFCRTFLCVTSPDSFL